MYDRNNQIIVLESDGIMIGKMNYSEAQSLARERGLSLIQVGNQNGTEVCKIMDRGKYLYEQKKKNKHKPTHQLKEMQFRMRIESHDQNVKINRIKEFLEKGHEVRIVVTMKGREKAHPELASQKLDQILNELNCDVKSSSSKRASDNISVLIGPKKHANERSESGRKEKTEENSRTESPVASGDGG